MTERHHFEPRVIATIPDPDPEHRLKYFKNYITDVLLGIKRSIDATNEALEDEYVKLEFPNSVSFDFPASAEANIPAIKFVIRKEWAIDG